MSWNRNFYETREAIHRSTDGQSGRYVYARARTNLREFRIVGFRFHRGLPFGRELATGKWVVIADWQER